MGKKTCVASLLALLYTTFLCVGLVHPTESFAAKRKGTIYLNFGGSQPGGSWFVMAGGLSAYLTREVSGVNLVAEATMGDVEDTSRIAQGDLDLTLTHSVTMAHAYKGTGVFKGKKPGKDVRVIAKMYDSPTTLVTLPDSPINSIMDLKGKTLAGGPQGSGSVKNLKVLLKTFGLSDAVTIKYFTYSDEVDALIEGHIDAFQQNSAPIGNVLSVEARKGIKIIPFSKEQAEIFAKKNPGFWAGDLPPGTYRTVKKPILTMWDTVFWVADASVPEDVVYKILKVVFSPKGKKMVAKIHKNLRQMGDGIKEDESSMGVPYHPGAIKFWREQGKTIPSNLIPSK